jgi:hypothetical protein
MARLVIQIKAYLVRDAHFLLLSFCGVDVNRVVGTGGPVSKNVSSVCGITIEHENAPMQRELHQIVEVTRVYFYLT